MTINDTLIQRIKERVSLQEMVSLNVILRRGGQNKSVGLCPFHAESTPSFYVFGAGKWMDQYHCYGCGVHGDVINYTMEINGMDFKEAVVALAQNHNIDISDCESNYNPKTVSKTIKPTYMVIAATTVRKTLCQYESNNFITFLNTYFNDSQLVNDLIQRYYIGTAKNNKTIFWLIDPMGCARTGQIILYDKVLGKRSRTEPILWTHSRIHSFAMEQCFFGLHLLATEPITKTIAIVESPKTAILMSGLMSDFIWLASCGKNGLVASKFESLAGRKMLLFPDLGRIEVKRNGELLQLSCFQYWKQATESLIEEGFDISVSAFLEKYVNGLPESVANHYISSGYDLADYAIDFDWCNEKRGYQKINRYSHDDLEWILALHGSVDNYEAYLEQRQEQHKTHLKDELSIQNMDTVQCLEKEKKPEIIEMSGVKMKIVKDRVDNTLLKMF